VVTQLPDTEQRVKTFPAELAFCRPWRKYQARLLERLDEYLADGRLHVVAAPGSGKTVLGLEVIRRIDEPTLVLAPTITIRDQWVDRLTTNFLPSNNLPPLWVSTDLRKPTALTVTTYQALHSICCSESEKHDEADENEEENSSAHFSNHYAEADAATRTSRLPEILERVGFRLVVVDEAHHLRTEWWRTLTFVMERLNKPRIVALTATPPYDVSPFEWERYQELCGPVDAEVSVPELVQQGDLCPHQDYVYFSTPASREQKAISDFRALAHQFAERLKENEPFQNAIAAHRWMRTPGVFVEEILEQPEYASSMLIYLHASGREVPEDVVKTLGLPDRKIPVLDLEWLEILLSRCLYSDAESYGGSQETLKGVRHELLTIGAVERRRVRLRNPADHLKLLTSSITKLKSIETIVKLEADALGEALRCVVLTDFIRRGEMPTGSGDVATFEDIGIVPIFETLRRAVPPVVGLGVLSGSVVVVPRRAEGILRDAAAELGLHPGDLVLTPMTQDQDYLMVELRGTYYQGAVRLLTSVFDKGGIMVLVGTKSLLGEGWDAPCINTLVLASFVGSYMLSNQMRGRSIRVDAKHAEKTANIWHLVCVEPGIFGPGPDYDLLVCRCGAFAGVSAKDLTIENGTARLGFGQPPFSSEELARTNTQTMARALDRAGLRKRWQEALESGSRKEMIDGLKAPPDILPRGFVMSNTIAALLTQAGLVFVAVFAEMMRVRMRGGWDFWLYIKVVAGISAIVSLPWLARAVWRFIRHGTPERSVRQIGQAILEALEYEGSIRRRARELAVFASQNRDGTVFCSVTGGGGAEQAIFLRTLGEVLAPIENPRYLLARTRLWRFFREDYFAVPEVLARKKEFAEMFAKKWARFVGPVDLVYTRAPEGRRLLLRARIHSLAAAFQKRAERLSCWK
jgi:superfamily II DNA or RNA helicase